MALSFAPLSSPHVEVYRVAVQAHRRGINALPIAGDGSKRPAVRWERYQHERVSLEDLKHWFLRRRYPGIALMTGAGLELLDFDDPESYHAWCEQMRARGLASLAQRVAQGYLEASPKGIHLLYRCQGVVEGNQKLAGRLVGPKRKTLIETRGQGGLAIVAPSGEEVHPSGKPYELLQGSIATITILTAQQRAHLLSAACALDELVHQTRPALRADRSGAPSSLGEKRKGRRPGDLFNQRATWEEVLEPHGWRLLYRCGDEGYWTKNTHVHATTNYQGSDLLYVFSTTTAFEPERGYSKFAAYVLLNYGRLDEWSFATAACDLVERGFCE